MGRSSEMSLQGNPADNLTDDLIVEILSRLPVKSVCRFKCVSWHWRRLIAHPNHRKKLPKTLSGFFCSNGVYDDDDNVGTVSNPHIVSDSVSDGGMNSSHILLWDTEDEDYYDYYCEDVVTATPISDFASILPAEEELSPVVPDPSLSFLPGYKSIIPKQCCSGHLLCYWEVPPPTTTDAQYVVCNPATQQWRTFPRGHRGSTFEDPPPLFLCLDDDSLTTSQFHVVALIENHDSYISGVDIYSSESGAWSHNDCGWGDRIIVLHQSVFLHGMLHLITDDNSKFLAVDGDRKTWNTIPLLGNMYDVESRNLLLSDPLIGKSQGRLLYMNHMPDDHFSIFVWNLEDYYTGGRWVLRYKYDFNTPEYYNLVAVHPDCNLVFFTVGAHDEQKFMSYDMVRGEVRVFRGMERTHVWLDGPYIPYVPSQELFAEEVVTN